MSDLKLYFSLISGDLYYVEYDEIKNLDNAQVPLVKKPKETCKKCFGRFYEGKHFNMNNNVWEFAYYQLCPKCAKKCIDWETVGDELKVETPKFNYTFNNEST